MSEEVLIRVRAVDQASEQIDDVAQAVKKAGDQTGRAGKIAGQSSSRWLTAGLATDKAGAAFARMSTKVQQNSGKIEAAGLVAAAAFGFFARSALTQFAAVEDASSALRATFGPQGQYLIEWSKKNGDALNLSQQEALGASQTFAIFAQSAGLAGKDLQTFTTDLTARAADLASYFGGSTADAVQALGSAMAGQSEVVRKYGILLTEDRLKAELFNVTGQKVTGTLTAQQKILATHSLIMKDSSRAAGDVARTQDSVANKIKDSQQQWADLQATLGENVAVMAGPMLQALSGVFGWVTKLPEPVRGVGLNLTAVGIAAMVAGPRILAAASAMKTLQASSAGGAAGLGKYGGSMRALGTAATVAAVGLPVIGAMVKNIGDSMYGATTTAGQLTDSLVTLSTGGDVKALGQFGDGLDTLGKEIDGLMNPKVTTRVADFFGTLAGQGGDQRRQLVLSQIAELDTAITGLAAADGVPAAERAFAALADKQGLSAEQTDELKRLMPQYADALALAAAEEKSAAAGADGLAGTLDDLDPAATGAEEAITGLTAAISRVQGFLAGRDAVRGYKAALDEFDASLKKNGETFNDNTAKGRANTAALDAIAQAATAAYTATDEAGNVTVANEKAYGRAAVTYYRNARALGMTAAEAANLTTRAFDAEAAATALGKVNARPKIAADITTLEDQLATVNGRIMALGQKERTPEIDAKITKAMAKSKLIQEALDTLNGKVTDPEVTATTTAAEESIGRVQAALTELDGKRVTVYVDVHQNRPIPGGTAPDGTGDTASPKATGGDLARTLARHAQISAGMAGMRVTNMLVGGGGRGRGSGDHQAGRAIDVQGPRLGDYVRRVRESGGFAELHGSGSDRHAHAVMGDTASPRSGAVSSAGVNVTVPVQVVGRINADEIAGLQQAITSAVGPAVSRWSQQRRERGK